MDVGFGEILLILLLILILFGPGRIAKTAGELGKGIKAFKDGLSENTAEENKSDSEGAEKK
jgi:sec-independent protein translocase protein TatA